MSEAFNLNFLIVNLVRYYFYRANFSFLVGNDRIFTQTFNAHVADQNGDTNC